MTREPLPSPALIAWASAVLAGRLAALAWALAAPVAWAVKGPGAAGICLAAAWAFWSARPRATAELDRETGPPGGRPPF